MDRYFDLFADDNTNAVRVAQFDQLVDELSMEARSRLLFYVDTLKDTGVSELAAKVTLLTVVRHLSKTHEQQLGAKSIGIQMNMLAKEPMVRKEYDGRIYKFMGEEL